MTSALARSERIAVLMGGYSAERAISLRSGAAVHAGLLKAGFDAQLIDVQPGWQQQLADSNCSMVWLALHGRGGEDGSIQGYLETMGIPYTGSNILGSALAMDKLRSKQLWQTLEVPTPDFVMLARNKLNDKEQVAAIVARLGLPLIIKPNQEGSSVGMAKITDLAELSGALHKAAEFDEHLLLEAWVSGEEYTVAVIDLGEGPKALPAIRLETPNDFYDYQAKYHSNQTQYHLPSGLTGAEESQLGDLCVKAFKTLGCSGWGRVDVMRDSAGRFLLLEVNTAPGMTETSLVPKAAKAFGMSFTELVAAIAMRCQPAQAISGQLARGHSGEFN